MITFNKNKYKRGKHMFNVLFKILPHRNREEDTATSLWLGEEI